jgi:alkanesulfonate monooxygenase SsuD/methylene tetrahydromethanopterin reductase-like flavin-dependent oxidoreductase (luciferase family)
MVNVGVVFRPQQPPEELEAVVRAVDAAGVPELWLWEDCFLEGGMTSATAALAWSTRLRVGIGLLPVPLRNPALVAMELATLERLWPGRLVPTLGHGVLDWMGQVGARVDSPMTLLREHAEAVRDLLEGRRVDVAGRYVRLDGVALDWPLAARPPLLVGARGDRTIRLAGEVGDGVLLDSVTDPGTVRRARALVDEARAGIGRPDRAMVTAYTQVDPGSPAGELAEQVAERVAVLSEAGADTVVLQGTGERPDPRPVVEALAATGLVTGRG